jgi:hypothetical protein
MKVGTGDKMAGIVTGTECKRYYVIVDTTLKTPGYILVLTKADSTDLFIKVDSLFDATMFSCRYEAQKSIDKYVEKRKNKEGVYPVVVNAALEFTYGRGVW